MRKSNSSGRREETWRHASSSALNPGTHHHLCCITGIWLDFLAGREWQRMKEEREGEGLLSKRLMTQCHANLLKATGWWKAKSVEKKSNFFASFLLRLSFVSWFFRGESKRDAWVIADRDSSIGSLCWYASTRSTNAPSLFCSLGKQTENSKNKRGNRRGNKCIKEEACCPHYQMSWRRTGVGSRKSGGVSWRIRKHTRLHYRVSISSSIICCRFFSPFFIRATAIWHTMIEEDIEHERNAIGESTCGRRKYKRRAQTAFGCCFAYFLLHPQQTMVMIHTTEQLNNDLVEHHHYQPNNHVHVGQTLHVCMKSMYQ